MANVRRKKRSDGPELTVIDGGSSPGPAELAELRSALSAAGAPEEVLKALESSGDPQEVLNYLIEAGLLPSPQESLEGLIEGFKPLLKPGCDQLSAELSGAEFLGMISEATPDPGEVPAILTELIALAEQHAKPEALAMLRVIEVTGPPSVRPTAAAAGDRLVQTGLKDRPWVAGLGVPEMVSCFGYTDRVGAQEAIAISFRYGRKPHALAVLIDHDLGGGVKDCWPTDAPDRIRTDYQKVAKRYELDFHDYEPGHARAILDRALSRPPCPVAPDQVEDVRDYLDLLRQRVALLPEADPAHAKTGTKRRRAELISGSAATRSRGPATARGGRAVGRGGGAGRTVHRVKVTLRGSKPPIWRRLEVPSKMTLHQLHETIQQAFGWQNYHMWVFQTQSGDYGIADPELGHRSAASKRLAEVAPHAGGRISYLYDFGDGWEHDLLVEDVLPAEPGVAYPRCLTGRRACPPEDSGGMWGYQDLLEILADPGHEEHADRLDWLGLRSADEFDPAHFDLHEVNEALSGLATVPTKG